MRRRSRSSRRAASRSRSTASTSAALRSLPADDATRCACSRTGPGPCDRASSSAGTNAAGGRGDLPPPRRHPARDRAGRRARRRDEPERDRSAARRTVPPAHRRPARLARTAPDAAGHGGVVVRVAVGRPNASCSTGSRCSRASTRRRRASVVADDELDAWSVLDAVEGLVRKSMLTPEEQPDGSTRYQMLETLRQYALEQLDDARRARHVATTARRVLRRVRRGDRARTARRRRAAAASPALRRPRQHPQRRRRGRSTRPSPTTTSSASGSSPPSPKTSRWSPASAGRCRSAERALDAARRSTPGRRAAVLASAAWEAVSRFDTGAAVAYGREAIGRTASRPTARRRTGCASRSRAAEDTTSASRDCPTSQQIFAQFEHDRAASRARSHLLTARAGQRHATGFRRGTPAGPSAPTSSRSALQNPSTIAQVSYHLGTLWARDEPERALDGVSTQHRVRRKRRQRRDAGRRAVPSRAPPRTSGRPRRRARQPPALDRDPGLDEPAPAARRRARVRDRDLHRSSARTKKRRWSPAPPAAAR